MFHTWSVKRGTAEVVVVCAPKNNAQNKDHKGANGQVFNWRMRFSARASELPTTSFHTTSFHPPV